MTATTYTSSTKSHYCKACRSLQTPAGQSLIVLEQFVRMVTYATWSGNKVILLYEIRPKEQSFGISAIKNQQLIQWPLRSQQPRSDLQKSSKNLAHWEMSTRSSLRKMLFRTHWAQPETCLYALLHDKLREELERVESMALGMISEEVDTPTPWHGGGAEEVWWRKNWCRSPESVSWGKWTTHPLLMRLGKLATYPSGKFCFNNLSFGISSATELFRKCMS